MAILWSVMRISLLTGLLFASMMYGCSLVPQGPRDGALTSYVESFFNEMDIDKEVMDEYKISFRSLDAFNDKDEPDRIVIGICYEYKKTMYIHPEFWYGSSESERRKTGLVYHELAHCVCSSNHVKDKFDDGCPTSLMYPTLPNNMCLRRHWNSYMTKLKKGCE